MRDLSVAEIAVLLLCVAAHMTAGVVASVPLVAKGKRSGGILRQAHEISCPAKEEGDVQE